MRLQEVRVIGTLLICIFQGLSVRFILYESKRQPYYGWTNEQRGGLPVRGLGLGELFLASGVPLRQLLPRLDLQLLQGSSLLSILLGEHLCLLLAPAPDGGRGEGEACDNCK